MRALIAAVVIAVAAPVAEAKPRAPRLAAQPVDPLFARYATTDTLALAYPSGAALTSAGGQPIAIPDLDRVTVDVVEQLPGAQDLIVRATGDGTAVIGTIAPADLRDTTIRNAGLQHAGTEPNEYEPGVFVRPGYRGPLAPVHRGYAVTLDGAIRATGVIRTAAVGKVFTPFEPPSFGDAWAEMPLYDPAAPRTLVPLRAGADPSAAPLGVLVEAVGHARVISTDGGNRTLEVIVVDRDAWAHGFVTLPVPPEDDGEDGGLGGFGLTGRGTVTADDVATGACLYLARDGALVGIVTATRTASFDRDGWGRLAFSPARPTLELWVHRDRAGAFDRCTP